MSAASTREARQAHEIVRWRRRQLTDAGFGLPLAARLARDRRWDLHALLELVERGCPRVWRRGYSLRSTGRKRREPRCGGC